MSMESLVLVALWWLEESGWRSVLHSLPPVIGEKQMHTMNGAVHFGAFEVDLRTEELLKHGLKLRLPRQSFQVLVLLLQRSGELVSREELRERLWPADTFVDFDHGLNAAVNRLREALGDSAEEPRFIETLPRRGYRFVGQITEMTPEPASVRTNSPATAPAPADTEVARENEQQTSNAAAQIVMKRARVLHWNWRTALLAAAVLLIATGGVWWRLRVQPRQYAIAVLPFKNLSPEPNSDYFSDGLTDEIIRDLSIIEGLQVKSRTSSSVFKDKPRNVHEVGSQLGANLLLEGSVLRAGERLRINVDLVRVADDSTLWSQRYDRDLKDVFAVQEEISRSIVNELRLKHVGGQRRYDTNLQAYDLYLRAESISDESKLGDAITLYRQVIAMAPDFAPAYAGLADVYAYLRHPRPPIAPDAEQQMRVTAEKAIQLDPLLPEAHGVMGLVYASDLAWGDAERSFQRALQLNPNLPGIHEDYGLFVLQPEGKVAEAVQQYREAVTLDPLSDSPRDVLAFGLINTGGYDEALEICRAARDPDDEDYARVLWFKGRHEEAIAILEKLDPSTRGFLGYMYGSIGRRREAEQIAAEQDPAAIRHQALVYAGLGDKDRVLEAFEKMAAMHDHIVDIYSVWPEFALMRDDPRMKEFRQKRNLPWPP
jgi:TolB-like protein/DNA-binding winged helix-turn-helix (wHTH) protein/Flp pilus assembly protein TadD